MGLKHVDELLRLLVGKRAEQQAVDDREDRGVGADAEGQGGDRTDREDRRAPENADGELQILPEGAEPLLAPPTPAGACGDLPALPGDPRHVAEGPDRLRAGGLGSPALLQQFLGPELDMLGDLAAHIFVDRLLVRERQRVVGVAAAHPIAPLGRASRARDIAAT